MINVLKEMLGKIWRIRMAKRTTPAANLKRPDSTRDFRAVEIAPCVMCCTAAMQVTGKSYLLRQAPRLPLMGCTMPTNCACKFRKNADRRDGDRRLFGAAETNRWFAGRESRKAAQPRRRRVP